MGCNRLPRRLPARDALVVPCAAEVDHRIPSLPGPLLRPLPQRRGIDPLRPLPRPRPETPTALSRMRVTGIRRSIQPLTRLGEGVGELPHPMEHWRASAPALWARVAVRCSRRVAAFSASSLASPWAASVSPRPSRVVAALPQGRGHAPRSASTLPHGSDFALPPIACSLAVWAPRVRPPRAYAPLGAVAGPSLLPRVTGPEAVAGASFFCSCHRGRRALEASWGAWPCPPCVAESPGAVRAARAAGAVNHVEVKRVRNRGACWAGASASCGSAAAARGGRASHRGRPLPAACAPRPLSPVRLAASPRATVCVPHRRGRRPSGRGPDQSAPSSRPPRRVVWPRALGRPRDGARRCAMD